LREIGSLQVHTGYLTFSLKKTVPRFVKILLESEMWSVMPRPGRKPHWVSFRLDSIISWHLFSKHLSTEMLIICQFPKSIAGRTKGPRGPHAARMFETPGLNASTKIII